MNERTDVGATVMTRVSSGCYGVSLRVWQWEMSRERSTTNLYVILHRYSQWRPQGYPNKREILGRSIQAESM